MSEWNGKLVSDMDTRHLENTLRHLEKVTRRKHGLRWLSFVDTVYFDIKDELSRRNSDYNFGAPR